jgi:hypothetical protein
MMLSKVNDILTILNEVPGTSVPVIQAAKVYLKYLPGNEEITQYDFYKLMHLFYSAQVSIATNSGIPEERREHYNGRSTWSKIVAEFNCTSLHGEEVDLSVYQELSTKNANHMLTIGTILSSAPQQQLRSNPNLFIAIATCLSLQESKLLHSSIVKPIITHPQIKVLSTAFFDFPYYGHVLTPKVILTLMRQNTEKDIEETRDNLVSVYNLYKTAPLTLKYYENKSPE